MMQEAIPSRRGLAQCTLRDYESRFAGRHKLHDVLRYWAERKPEAVALVDHRRGQRLCWREFESRAAGLARELLRLGFAPGDYLAVSLPFLIEHILLEYACFQIGVIHAPLDLRLPAEEVIRSLGLIRAKGFVFAGRIGAADWSELGRAVRARCPFVQHRIQFAPPEETVAGATPWAELAARADAPAGGAEAAESEAARARAAAAVREEDGAQVIFTTGSTGPPKPALLSHRNITCQNMCLGAAFGFGQDTRLLINLPPSHVGGQSETLMTTLFWGGTAVVLDLFDAAASLAAIQEHRVNLLGQIPAMFNFQWRLPDYARYDLSSLELAVYGGQQVARPFLERLAAMAPGIATGLGLTEAAGFCTYTPPGAGVEDILDNLGYAMPVYPLSIRQAMREDGRAGDELPEGEIGHICFRGPQTFLGYVNDQAATAQTVSREGYLYTGDMGFKDSRGLHLAGRAKWVIKPAGYQIFPGQVEQHFCALADKVAACGVVGVPHPLLTEALVAFVEKRPGAELSVAELRRHARGLASYLRPLYYVLLEPGQMPLNRAAKLDYLRLKQMALVTAERQPAEKSEEIS